MRALSRGGVTTRDVDDVDEEWGTLGRTVQ